MTTKETLTKWRREALLIKSNEDINPEELIPKTRSSEISELCEHILHLTQELMDLHLIRGR